jgi:hypothetical protein
LSFPLKPRWYVLDKYDPVKLDNEEGHLAAKAQNAVGCPAFDHKSTRSGIPSSRAAKRGNVAHYEESTRKQFALRMACQSKATFIGIERFDRPVGRRTPRRLLGR